MPDWETLSGLLTDIGLPTVLLFVLLIALQRGWLVTGQNALDLRERAKDAEQRRNEWAERCDAAEETARNALDTMEAIVDIFHGAVVLGLDDDDLPRRPSKNKGRRRTIRRPLEADRAPAEG